ncbi:DUF4145 domain-containing protein [Isoptericola sp. 4D.3]|uniref:DUF4145 domain-containing protein n=1 Tax=Isoptericola peretonis TaxID=2918523 RepID=A0ABT0J1F1_9MICO|nr:DUF4145 domain-containing protein [Isoptericola sp. 4D.3]
MANLTDDLIVVSATAQNQSSSSAWRDAICPNCGRAQCLVVAAAKARKADNLPPEDAILWLRCISCRMGIVINGDVQSPGADAVGGVRGLPSDVADAWNEVRVSLAGGANTGAVMMCRKILFHVAVEHGMNEKTDKGRAPTFAQVLDHLRDVGLVTPPMMPWVERIRDVGNEANHELPATSLAEATRVATFTHQLLVLVFQMAAEMVEALGSHD